MKKIKFLILLLIATFNSCNSQSNQPKENCVVLVNNTSYAIRELYFAQNPNYNSEGQWNEAEETEWETETSKNLLANDVLPDGKSFTIKLKYPANERNRFFIKIKLDNGNTYSRNTSLPVDNKIIITKEDVD